MVCVLTAFAWKLLLLRTVKNNHIDWVNFKGIVQRKINKYYLMKQVVISPFNVSPNLFSGSVLISEKHWLNWFLLNVSSKTLPHAVFCAPCTQKSVDHMRFMLGQAFSKFTDVHVCRKISATNKEMTIIF